MPRTIVTPDGAASVTELFARAESELANDEPAAAAKSFDTVSSLDPDGDLACPALFNAGVAYDRVGDVGTALARFDSVAARFPERALARHALVRSARLLIYTESWADAAKAADRLLPDATDLEPLELVVLYGAKAYYALANDRDQDAAYFIEKGSQVIDRHGLDAAGWIPRDLAQLYFALGEVRRIRGERIRFDPVPADFAAVLEQRCQLLLDAQGAYSDAMRARDAHWSAMAGFRVGELYARLHEDVMNIRAPAAAKTLRDRQLFEGTMRLRYSILLDKGLAMMSHTLEMAAREGERSPWVQRAAEAKSKLELAKETEKRALDQLPFSRGEIQAALDGLARRKQGASP